MPAFTIRQWDRLSEDELWDLATDRWLDASLREEAMWRWLFPAEYGYWWANHRVQRLRAQYLGMERNKGIVSLATVPTIG